MCFQQALILARSPDMQWEGQKSKPVVTSHLCPQICFLEQGCSSCAELHNLSRVAQVHRTAGCCTSPHNTARRCNSHLKFWLAAAAQTTKKQVLLKPYHHLCISCRCCWLPLCRPHLKELLPLHFTRQLHMQHLAKSTICQRLGVVIIPAVSRGETVNKASWHQQH